MKITIAIYEHELAPILSKHLGVEVESVSIIPQRHQAIDKLRCCVEELRYNSDQKISAIKALRTFADNNPELFIYRPDCLGLADAKWAVENWSEFISFLRKHNHAPRPGYSAGLLP